MLDVDERLEALRSSPFRARFKLTVSDYRYLADRCPDTVRAHTRKFIQQRLAPAQPENDGKQTPMRGHPVFVAQHATATCCRNCLAKWHDIAKGKPLTDAEIDYVIGIIQRWLEIAQTASPIAERQRQLFPTDDAM